MNSSYHITQDPLRQGPTGDVNNFYSTGGADTAMGTWEITIPDIQYMTAGSGSEIPVQVTGPWKLIVELP